ncbi:MAG: hypothetical protein HYV63_32725 [Candidatus Schekmanbacteria bacterium]|nr:hypothetical protein [Candidatus Schekmanbacteria bacterium]
MSKMSQEVANRVENANFVASAGAVHGDAVIRGLGKLPAAPPAEVLSSVLAWLRELLSSNTEALRLGELAYTAEQADDPGRALLETRRSPGSRRG